MSSIFNIGISGLQAAQLGLSVTQHNIANSNTDGYSRQSVIRTTATPTGYGTGFVGNGVKVSTVERAYSSFLTSQVRQSDTAYAALEAYSGQIDVVDALLADESAGVSPVLQSFFAAVQQVSASPNSLPARQVMVSAAESLVARFNGSSQRLMDLYDNVNAQLEDNIDVVNSYGKQIANLNEQITLSQAGTGQSPNDLLDQRDQLVSELNKIVKVEVIPMGANGLEVLIGKGQLLVMGNNANQMAAVRSSIDPARTTVALDQGSGFQELPEEIFDAGVLGGLLQFRDQTLDGAINALGKVATSLALTFNAQHAGGMDLLGNSVGVGGQTDANFVADFFQIPEPSVIPRDTSSPTVSASFLSPSLNSMLSSGNYVTNVTSSDYRLEFNSGTLTMTRLSDNASWSSTVSVADLNSKITSEGISLDDGGAANLAAYSNGDSYLIQPTRDAAGEISIDSRFTNDVRLIAAAQPVRTSIGTTNTGTMKVAVERVRVDDSVASLGSLSYPLTIQLDAAGHLQFNPASSAPTKLNVIDSLGNITTDPTFSASAASTTTIGGGRTFELWDGDRRIMLSISGTAKAGDTFTISMNDASGGGIGVADSGNIVLLGKLLTQNTSDGGTSTYQSAYAQMVSDVGNKAREVEVTRDAQKSLGDQAGAYLEAYSGVNLDEEAANLLKFQQLYQAASRSISVGQKMFDEILSIAAAS